MNGDSKFPVPKDAYYMSGVGGQTTLIVPSHDLVVVRLGHYKGAVPGGRALRKAVAAADGNGAEGEVGRQKARTADGNRQTADGRRPKPQDSRPREAP